MAEIENKTLGTKLVTAELTQGMLENYLDKLKGKADMPVGKYYGEMLRAALDVGWVLEPSIPSSEVVTMKPKAVRWYGETLDKLYGEETTVPKE